MRQILSKILIGSIHRLTAEIVLGFRGLFSAVYLLDEMTLRASNAVQRRLAGLGLRHEQLRLFGELTDMGSVAAETKALIFSRRGGQVCVQSGSKGRRMDRARQRGGFPLFKNPLMAAFAFAGIGKGFFDDSLRFGILRRPLLDAVGGQAQGHQERANNASFE